MNKDDLKNQIDRDLLERKELARKLYLEEGMTCQDIAKDPRIDRHFTRIYTWRRQGKWDLVKKRRNEIARLKLENLVDADTEIKDTGSINDKEVVSLVLNGLGIDWNYTKELEEQDFIRVLSAIIKGLMQTALEDVISGKIRYHNPYQIHDFLKILFKEHHLTRGEPTDIRQTLIGSVLPDDDIKALSEGIKRLKQIADRKKLNNAEDDIIEIEAVNIEPNKD